MKYFYHNNYWVKESPCSSQVVGHQAGTYLRFQLHDVTGNIVYNTPDGMIFRHRVSPCFKFADTHLDLAMGKERH